MKLYIIVIEEMDTAVCFYEAILCTAPVSWVNGDVQEAACTCSSNHARV